MATAYLNRIGTAVPEHDIHDFFVTFGHTLLAPREGRIFARMAERAGIAHRFSPLAPGDVAAGAVDAEGFYRRGSFPGTAARMARYEPEALALARRAVAGLDASTAALRRVTHLVVASCTGFTAPGLDLQLAQCLGLRRDVQRTLVGFMGCSAAIPALRIARQAVLADPDSVVLVVNAELCTLHMQETADLESVLAFLLFADGASAALVSAAPEGLALGDFRTDLIADSADLITWQIGDHGFEMHLSGRVPARIAQALAEERAQGRSGGEADGILRGEGTQAVDLWAVHAGGRSVLDAVEGGLAFGPDALGHSRAVLSEHGNMSSATVMFVLARMLAERPGGARGMALAFGPGLVAESFRFRMAA